MAGIATARSIDIHAHAVLEETMGAAGRFGPELTVAEDGRPLFRVGDYKLHGVRYRGSPFMDPDLRIKRMETPPDYKELENAIADVVRQKKEAVEAQNFEEAGRLRDSEKELIGQKEAKEVMKTWNKEKKIKSCNQCHEKLAPKYELKADGLEQFKKLGGK